MCYYRDGQTRREARLCRDQDTEDGSTGVGGGALADLATLPSCWLAGCFFVVVVVAGQQHPRQFPERRRLQARHFRFDLWKNTEDLEARNEKIAAPQQFKNLSYPGLLASRVFSYHQCQSLRFLDRFLRGTTICEMGELPTFWTWISRPNEIPKPDPTAFSLWPPREQHALLSLSLSGF